MHIQFTTQVWREGDRYVGYAKELDVSTSGRSLAEVKTRLREAVEGFLEEAERMGTLEQILASQRTGMVAILKSARS